MVSRRSLLHLAAGVAALSTISRPASAQTYPTRPVKLVIPFPPGGVNDALGRPWAERIKPLLGTVIVENIGGAGGVVGISGVARAQPDGYTLVVGNSGNMVVAPAAASRPPYDAVRDFELIYQLASAAGVIAIHPALPVQDLKELANYAKTKRGDLSYGSPGVGTGNHLAAEMFKRLTDLPDLVHVPYRGAGPLLTDLIGGQIVLASLTLTGQVLDLHKAGRLRVLAVTGPSRVRGAPDFPTAVEAGFADLTFRGFFGLFAPKGTPSPILERLADATRTVLADGDLQRLFVASGFEPNLNSSPASFRRTVEEERARLEPIVKTMGLRLD